MMKKINLNQSVFFELTDEGWQQVRHYLEKLVGDDPFGDEGIEEGLRRIRRLTYPEFDENNNMKMCTHLGFRAFVEIFGEAIKKGIIADDTIYLGASET